jgi:hypothetical protein
MNQGSSSSGNGSGSCGRKLPSTLRFAIVPGPTGVVGTLVADKRMAEAPHPYKCSCGEDLLFRAEIHADGTGGGHFTTLDGKTKLAFCPRCQRRLDSTEAAIRWTLGL